MKKESALRKAVKDCVKRLGSAGIPVHISWIESHATSAGFPDVDYCCYGVVGQLELKAFPDIEVRATQVTWFKDRIKAGGHPLFLIQCQDLYIIVPGSRATDIRRNPSEENVLRWASSVWHGSLPEYELLKVMRNPRNEYAKIIDGS